MALGDPAIFLAGLLQIDVPIGTVRFSDGPAVNWAGNLFLPRHDVFGIIAASATVEEGAGDELPQWSVSFAPPSDAAAATLCTRGWQGRRIRLWLAEINSATGQPVGTPDPHFDGLIGQRVLRIGIGQRMVDFACISRAERLLLLNEGNTLSDSFHKRIWPGERGLENATDVPLTKAWGTTAPPRGVSASSGFAGGIGSGGGFVGAGQSSDLNLA